MIDAGLDGPDTYGYVGISLGPGSQYVSPMDLSSGARELVSLERAVAGVGPAEQLAGVSLRAVERPAHACRHASLRRRWCSPPYGAPHLGESAETPEFP